MSAVSAKGSVAPSDSCDKWLCCAAVAVLLSAVTRSCAGAVLVAVACLLLCQIGNLQSWGDTEHQRCDGTLHVLNGDATKTQIRRKSLKSEHAGVVEWLNGFFFHQKAQRLSSLSALHCIALRCRFGWLLKPRYRTSLIGWGKMQQAGLEIDLPIGRGEVQANICLLMKLKPTWLLSDLPGFIIADHCCDKGSVRHHSPPPQHHKSPHHIHREVLSSGTMRKGGQNWPISSIQPPGLWTPCQLNLILTVIVFILMIIVINGIMILSSWSSDWPWSW